MTQSKHQAETCDTDDKSCCCSVNETSIERDLKSHWNRAYETTESNKLGWFEDIPEPSLRLLNDCNLGKSSCILNIGAGTTYFVDELLNRNFENIFVNDISPVAIDKLKSRISDKHQKNIQWIEDDLTQPVKLNKLTEIDLWHDRAVLHFFQDQKEQDTYFNLLKKLVKINGYVIIAAFNLNGAEKCSGLPVFRYNEEMLEQKLGKEFVLKRAFNHTYFMPSGNSREYVYTLFKRIVL